MTRSFPAGGAPPPPPPSPPPVDPGAPPSVGGLGPTRGDDATQVSARPYGYGPGPAPGAPPTPGPQGYGPPGYGAVPAPPPAGRAGRGRILGRALLVLVVIGALAATTAWGFVNRSSAERWRDRSEAADADLRQALERVEVASADLEDARTRLRELANEKAGETDRNRILSEIVAQAPAVTAALADCQQETATLANDVLAAGGDPAAEVAGIEARIDEVNALCATALDQAEALQSTIDALGI